MNKSEVISLLKEHRSERGIAKWNARAKKKNQLKSFGIGLTQLRKLAKQVGRNHELAQQLWSTDIYDAKIIGLLIDEPKKMTREQAERQLDEMQVGLFAHVFASCSSALAKTTFAFELACDWMNSKDQLRRRCGYTLLYELSKKNIAGMDDDFLIERINHITHSIHDEDMWVREAMNGALIGVGKRNLKLNKAAIRAAKAIGPVDVDYGPDNSCEPVDALKHLTTDYLQQRLRKP